MAVIHALTDTASWDSLWDGQAAEDAPLQLILERSPLCSISRAAEAAFQRFAEGLPETPRLRLHRVDVVHARDLSQRIARDTGVRHESPQVLLIGGGRRLLWHASHHSIDERALAEAVEKAGAGSAS